MNWCGAKGFRITELGCIIIWCYGKLEGIYPLAAYGEWTEERRASQDFIVTGNTSFAINFLSEKRGYMQYKANIGMLLAVEATYLLRK